MRKTLFFFAILLSATFNPMAQTVSPASCTDVITDDEALLAANYQMAGSGTSVINSHIISHGGSVIAWIYDLAPAGYIVVTASKMFPPVLAYSFTNNFGGFQSDNPLFAMLKADLLNRTKAGSLADPLHKNELLWDRYLNPDQGSRKSGLFTQWPATGEGWLMTNYTQESPYNDLCPIDPVTSQRSYAGCPAVAMAQIVNFHQTTNSIHFDDGDDYYHNYDGRQYRIDDDYSAHGFPSFPQLNDYLDTLNVHWAGNIVLGFQDVAALTFACGVACTQVFTSQGSGTFGVGQAFDAYQRFGFTTAELLQADDPDLFNRMSQNIKDTLPVHLAVVDEQWTSGHNVVVDGYNTSEFYHLNFGWGGTSNGWYLLPEGFPYNLTVIEGVIVDIHMDTTTTASHNHGIMTDLSVFPNPATNNVIIRVTGPDHASGSLKLLNASGQVLQTIEGFTEREIMLNVENRPAGLYLLTFVMDNGTSATRRLIIR